MVKDGYTCPHITSFFFFILLAYNFTLHVFLASSSSNFVRESVDAFRTQERKDK